MLNKRKSSGNRNVNLKNELVNNDNIEHAKLYDQHFIYSYLI